VTTLLWGAALIALVGYGLYLATPESVSWREESSAEAVAVSMLVLQKAAVDWCLGASGCPDGAVPTGQLNLPPAYAAAPWLVSRAAGGRISTYVSGVDVPAGDIVEKLEDLVSGGPSSGIVSAAATVIARDVGQPGRVPISLGSGFPTGVPIVTEQVK
jgi:hypothetical protein